MVEEDVQEVAHAAAAPQAESDGIYLVESVMTRQMRMRILAQMAQDNDEEHVRRSARIQRRAVCDEDSP